MLTLFLCNNFGYFAYVKNVEFMIYWLCKDLAKVQFFYKRALREKEGKYV